MGRTEAIVRVVVVDFDSGSLRAIYPRDTRERGMPKLRPSHDPRHHLDRDLLPLFPEVRLVIGSSDRSSQSGSASSRSCPATTGLVKLHVAPFSSSTRTSSHPSRTRGRVAYHARGEQLQARESGSASSSSHSWSVMRNCRDFGPMNKNETARIRGLCVRNWQVQECGKRVCGMSKNT